MKLEKEEIVDALGNDGSVSMLERVKRPNPWRKMVIMMITKGTVDYIPNTCEFPGLLC